MNFEKVIIILSNGLTNLINVGVYNYVCVMFDMMFYTDFRGR